MAFLDNTGLGTVWGRIKTLFGAGFADLVNDSTSVTIKLQNGYGNDLDTVAIPLADSTNSKAGLMAPGEKSKLAGIAAGAEVNVQSDWNATSGDAMILNKPTIPSPGTGTSYPAMDGTRALGTQAGYARVDHVHPSDSTKVDKETGKGLSTNDYTNADKTKVGYVDTGKNVTTYVSEQISTAMTGSAKYKGTVGTGGTVTTLPTSGYKQGDYYVVCAEGTYAGETCEVGDMIFANKDYASGAVAADDWDIVQSNITAMTTAEINAICA